MNGPGLDPVPQFTAARSKSPADFELAFILGMERFGSKDGQEIGPSDAARTLRPKNHAVWVNLGDASRPTAGWTRPSTARKKPSNLTRSSPWPTATCFRFLQGQRDYDQAIACFRKAIALDPDLAEAHGNLGEALKKKGQGESDQGGPEADRDAA